MEKDPNPFPEIDLLPSLTAALRFAARLLTPFVLEAPDFMSNHNTGAAPMLDRQLYDSIEVHGFRYTGEPEQLDFGFGDGS